VTIRKHRVCFTTRSRGAASVLAMLLAFLWPAASSSAVSPGQKKPEKPYALIYGTVFGPDGRTVYGIHVFIRRADQKKPKWDLYSDHSGEFAQRVPAGRADYVVSADVKGHKLLNGKKIGSNPEVTVNIENDERANVSLHLTK
jgi:hypothetical protein